MYDVGRLDIKQINSDYILELINVEKLMKKLNSL